MLLEALNFIAVPLVIAVIQCVLFWIILGRVGLPRWAAFLPFVQIVSLIAIYILGGWMGQYEMFSGIPAVIPLYQLLMVLIGFVPLFALAFARWPLIAR